MSEQYYVTGDRGFVGSHLRERLLALGHRVVGIDRVPPTEARAVSGYEPVTVDLADRRAVLDVFGSREMPATLFHMAARLSATDDDPLQPHLEANLRTAENLLEAIDGRGVAFIASSTMSVYGLPPDKIPVCEDDIPRPCEAYGVSKLAAECTVERMARAGRISAVVLRYAGIFGPGYNYGALHLYASKALGGEPISVYGNGAIIRDYVHVEDVVSANLLAARAAQRLGWGLFHIGGGEPSALAAIARMVVDACGGGTVETNDRPGTFDFGFDITQARKQLGYAPPPLKERIAQYVRNFRLHDKGIAP